MQYFDQDFLDFFIELAANNNKDWFDVNRKRYEQSVKKPFEKFVSDLIAEVRKHDPNIRIEAKDAIFRINRDIRFSQDKSLYKLDRSAVISPAGRKDHSEPGFYLSLGPEKAWMGGGAYFMKPDQLAKIREAIRSNMKGFEKAINSSDFKKYFGSLQGDEHKRVPKEMKEDAEKQPLLYKKQLYYMVSHEPEIITSDKLMPIMLDHYHASVPVQRFFSNALS